MFSYFGVKQKAKPNKPGPKPGGVKKPPVSHKTEMKHKYGTLIYQSPLFNYLYHHSDGRHIVIPVSTSTNYRASDELFWVFRADPEQDPSTGSNLVPKPTQQNVNSVYVKMVKNRKVVTVWYNDAYRTIRFAGSEEAANTNVATSQRKPIFYIEVYDETTGKATKRLFGDVVYVPTPPNSPQGSPRRTSFGKKRKSKFSLKKLRSHLKLLMRC
jgi:hypothetical protein